MLLFSACGDVRSAYGFAAMRSWGGWGRLNFGLGGPVSGSPEIGALRGTRPTERRFKIAFPAS